MYSLAVVIFWHSFHLWVSLSFILFFLVDKEVVWWLAPALLSAGQSVARYYANVLERTDKVMEAVKAPFPLGWSSLLHWRRHSLLRSSHSHPYHTCFIQAPSDCIFTNVFYLQFIISPRLKKINKSLCCRRKCHRVKEFFCGASDKPSHGDRKIMMLYPLWVRKVRGVLQMVCKWLALLKNCVRKKCCLAWLHLKDGSGLFLLFQFNNR